MTPEKSREELLVDVCVDLLPEDERQVIEGLYWERIGLGTLAKRMGLTKWQVRNIRRRALARLEAFLTEED